MALVSYLLTSKLSLQRSSSLSKSLLLIPNISSSLFSTLCRDNHHPSSSSSSSSSPAPPASPPLPKKLPFTLSLHGTTWQDPYRWMSDTNDPDLSDHLNQENQYADAFMADTHNLRRTLVSEMTCRMPTNISTPPERWGPWLYYQYIPEGKEYPVLCRRLEIENSGWIRTFLSYARGGFEKEEVLLDWNAIAEQYGYVHVGTCRVSPDHHFLAYTLDTKGSEQFMLQIKDLRSGCVIPNIRTSGVVSLAWAQDSCSLFYTLSDENQRPYRVLCSKLGSDMDDITVFTESDPSFCVDITSTKDGKFITVNSNSRTSSEVYLIDSANPLDSLQKVWKRVSDVQYFLEHHHGIFYVLTNAPLSESMEWCGEGYYLARCHAEDLPSSTWQHQLKIEDLNPWFFPLPSNSCSVAPGSNHDFKNPAYRVVLSSPVMPDVVVDYDMTARRLSVVQQEELRDFYDTCPPANKLNMNQTLDKQYKKDKNVQSESQIWKDFSGEYFCDKREVSSHDGVKVPLTLLYSHKAWKKGQSPGLLQGYGAYGEDLDKSWCTDRLSLLDRGWVMAFADVRGSGGDSSWHKAGSQYNKLNSIYDFVSCGNYLIKEGYVHRDQLSAIGHSAGGLLVGATINMCPDLFRAAILKVPFLDVCNTLMDPTLPLTILDYEEFGNPQIKSQFEHILSYSPYDNISKGSCYPSMLVTASFHDSRVGFWEAAKWVARVRDDTCPVCSSSVILKTNMAGGHFGEGGRYAQCEETAYDYAFLFKAMGLLQNEK